ncbi:putative sporulation protein YtxC [Oceanirhabdus sp. W0125-5]|uniref:putative sporulation protein YtxC n=1 Tax=Oceanirhabdus sp. W0125-5 TaxID=2999116 RepID=UPI0022F2E286|nr:putative sporulation protein YtxC [Oceanirhabdus sp. W0125-5]WBW99403.1 putative sporulation protein YtxC [Oceanirhabdus sp. W0125-5]
MLIYSVVYNKKNDDIIEELKDIKKLLEMKGINLGYSECVEEDNHFIKIYCCNEEEVERGKKLFNIYLSNYLSKIITKEYIERELNKLIKEMYFFLKGNDTQYVKKEMQRILIKEENINDEDFIYFMNIKNVINEKIIRCLSEYDQMNIKGFLTFRLKDLKQDFELIVDKIVERYMVKKEYEEFIKLLRYFVEIQECKLDEVNIIVNERGEYGILDKGGRDILSRFLQDVNNYKISGSVSIDDVIISGLITNVPKRVIIHGADNCKNEELIDTIKNVFLDRVAFCDGCSLCVEDLERYKEEELRKYEELNLE